MTRIVLILLALSLSSCGFHLRGRHAQIKAFSFASLYIKSAAPSPFVVDLESGLEVYKIKLVTTAAEADLTLDITSETSDKQISVLSGAGQVREFQLRYRVSLRAYDKQLNDWIPADEISLQRTLTFTGAEVLAKEQEEALLFKDMRADAVQQVIRRLSRAKLRKKQSKQSDTANSPAPVTK